MSVKVEDVAQGYAHSDVFHGYASSQLEYPFSLPLSWVKPVFLIPYYFTSTIRRSGMQTYLDFVMSNGVAMLFYFYLFLNSASTLKKTPTGQHPGQLEGVPRVNIIPAGRPQDKHLPDTPHPESCTPPDLGDPGDPGDPVQAAGSHPLSP